MSTTTYDFQRFIRDQKDKQHMYTQDQDWPAVKECMTEIRSLAERQRSLGELKQTETEKYLECEEQIRAINHIMNVMEVQDIQNVEEQIKLDKQKQALTQEQEAWKSLMDMRNSLKEPEKTNPVEGNKMEVGRESDDILKRSTEDNTLKLEFDEQKQDRQLEFENDQRRRNAELDIGDRNRIILKEKYQIYERMLQLGHNWAAVELLLDITERITTERNRSANRVGGV